MPNNPNDLPDELSGPLSRIGDALGDDARRNMEALVRELLSRLDSATLSNPLAANSMFVARPTGYVF
jgi:hypothetical protein